MYTDLHIHTIYSDGEYTPVEIIEKARKAGITTLSITDHNNLKGTKEAILNNKYDDLTIIPGVELSAKSESNINIHILGYNMDLHDYELNDLVDAYEKDSVKQVKSLICLLKSEYDITFKEDDMEKIFNLPGNIGRTEVAKICVDAGYATSVEDAFKRLLNPVKHMQVKKNVNPTDEALIKYIIDAGGVPCLAHPESLKLEVPELKIYIKELMTYGLEAIEVYHSKNPRMLTIELEKIADEFGLYKSAGSDYHGPIVSPNVEIRHGLNDNLNIKWASILSRIGEVKEYVKKN